MDKVYLKKLCKLIRYDILTSTTEAGSGHPTSSLSATELMTTLFFSGFYHFDLKNPKSFANDRIIFSKGHASPLLYSLYHAAGAIDYKELLTLRKFGSPLQGHPTSNFPYVEVATGSLGQGLSVGVGMALGLRLKTKNNELIMNRTPKIWVLMGDSEMAEGQVWEAMEIAGFYKLNDLIGIIDVNRLGQQGETEEGWDLHDYKKKVEAFGWNAIVVDDGHDLNEVYKAFKQISSASQFLSHESLSQKNFGPLSKVKKIAYASDNNSKPTMIIAKTIKGKGVSFLENKNGWHGKVLDREQLKTALYELGEIDLEVRGKINLPVINKSKVTASQTGGQMTNIKPNPNDKSHLKLNNILQRLDIFDKYNLSSKIHHLGSNFATREAYGEALVELGKANSNIVVLDAEVANSTYENGFQKVFPDRFFEMFIAEENMMGVALGLSKMGYIPYVATFAAFLTQTFDQVRMAQYSQGNLKIVGSHCGVSIGQDGPSQMGLEDIAMMRSILTSTIFYPGDAVSTSKLTKIMAENAGIFYLRTTRGKTPAIYDEKEKFEIGGFKVHKVRKSIKSKVLVVTAGITLHEALKAQKVVDIDVIDLYSVKPINKTLNQIIKNYQNIIVVEDHYPSGGIGDAVLSALFQNDKFLINLISKKNSNSKTKDNELKLGHSLGQLDQLVIKNFIHLCVRKMPMSGSSEELLCFEEIDAQAIVDVVKKL